MLVIDLGRFGASIFDLDGVITRTASVHARAWKRLFDEFLARQAAQTGTPFVPFNLETDYQRYVDGKASPSSGAPAKNSKTHIYRPVGESHVDARTDRFPRNEAERRIAQYH
jgi:beta-phosphoglucomutase-like phosphatase (HAD superfamily)